MALGALNAFELMYDIDKVRMTIYQPRIDNVSAPGKFGEGSAQVGRNRATAKSKTGL
jgi:hypothetical protein